MNNYPVSIKIGSKVIPIDPVTFQIMLEAIDHSMGDGILNNKFTEMEIDEANEARSQIEFAR